MSQRVSLDQLQVREPCHESWDAMHAQDGGRRHCDSCAKSVHDFAAMSRAEVDELLSRPGELPCVRFSRGGDGRVLTRDDFAGRSEPVPTRRVWLRRVATIAATFGLGSLFNFGCNHVEAKPAFATGRISQPPTTAPIYPGQAVMGDVDRAPAPTTEPVAKMGEVTTIGEPAVVGKIAPLTTQPTTQPVSEPTYVGATMGIIAPRR